MGYSEDRFDERRVPLVFRHSRQKRAVDLESVDRQAFKVPERRVTGTEVVDRELNARVLKRSIVLSPSINTLSVSSSVTYCGASPSRPSAS